MSVINCGRESGSNDLIIGHPFRSSKPPAAFPFANVFPSAFRPMPPPTAALRDLSYQFREDSAIPQNMPILYFMRKASLFAHDEVAQIFCTDHSYFQQVGACWNRTERDNICCILRMNKLALKIEDIESNCL